MAISKQDFLTGLKQTQAQWAANDAYQKKVQSLNQSFATLKAQQIEAGLQQGQAWESISKNTGVPLDLVKAYSQKTRPNYGVVNGPSTSSQIGTEAKGLAQGIFGGAEQFGSAIVHTPQMLAADISNNPVAQAHTQQDVFGTTDQNQILAKILGDTAQTASFAVGGGGLLNAARAGGLKAAGIAAGKTAAGGALAGGGQELSNDPNLTPQSVLAGALQGAAFGTALSGVAAGAKLGVGKIASQRAARLQLLQGAQAAREATQTLPTGTTPLEVTDTPAFQRRIPQTVGDVLDQQKLGVNNVPDNVLSANARSATQPVLPNEFTDIPAYIRQNPAQAAYDASQKVTAIDQKIQKLGDIKQVKEIPTKKEGALKDLLVQRRQAQSDLNLANRALGGAPQEPDVLAQVQQTRPDIVQQAQEAHAAVEKNTTSLEATPAEAEQLQRDKQNATATLQGAAQVQATGNADEAALLDPNINWKGTTDKVRQNQSVLRDAIVKQYPHLEKILTPLTHEVHNQDILTNNARALVNQDPEAAANIFTSQQLRNFAPDAHAKLGYELTQRAADNADTKLMNRAFAGIADVASQTGQTLRALRMDNIVKAEQIIQYANKIAYKTGRTITPQLVDRLKGEARKIDLMPDGPDKLAALAKLKGLAENPNILQKGAGWAGDFAGSVRAILASTDLSGGGRQGLMAWTRFPILGSKAEAAGARAAIDPNYYDQHLQKLTQETDMHGVPIAPGYALAGIHVGHGAEEQFQNKSIAEKIPGLNTVLNGSERAYSLTLQDMRAHILQHMINDQGGMEQALQNWSGAQWKAAGRVIDTITGRGRGGTPLRFHDSSWFEKAAPALSQTFFSARLWKSRLEPFNPAFYIQVAKNPAALKLAIQAEASFATTIGAVLGAVSLIPGVHVETDLRSSDFGKVKVGNTRIDLMGGYQQGLVTAYREIAGKYKSSSTGNIYDLNNPQFGGLGRFDILSNTVENKMAPVLSEIIRQIKGTDISGQKMTWTDRAKNIGGNFVPLSIQDVYSGAKDSGVKGAALGLTGIVGAGASTYGPPQKDWNQNQSKQVTEFKGSVDSQTFKQANNEFNTLHTQLLQNLEQNDKYNALSPKDQAQLRTTLNNELEKQIISKYSSSGS